MSDISQEELFAQLEEGGEVFDKSLDQPATDEEVPGESSEDV